MIGRWRALRRDAQRWRTLSVSITMPDSHGAHHTIFCARLRDMHAIQTYVGNAHIPDTLGPRVTLI